MVEKSFKIKARRRSIYNLKFAILGLASFILSSIVFANSYALIFNKPIPISNSVGYIMNSQYVIDQGVPNSVKRKMDEAEFIGDYGVPVELRLPKYSNKVFLIPALSDGERFLWRVNNAQYIFRSQSSKGYMGNLIIYMSSDWRTIDINQELAVDDNIFIDTQRGWRYMFRVVEAQKYDKTVDYVAPSSGQNTLILLIEDPQTKQSIIYFAQYVSLQNIAR